MGLVLTLLVSVLAQTVCLSPDDGRLVDVMAERDCTQQEYLDRVFDDYSDHLQMDKVAKYIKLLIPYSNRIHLAAISYATTDADGNEITASGVVAYPVGRKWKGTVEITPGMKSKSQVASSTLVSIELMPSLFGYVTIIPDMLGFGVSGDYPIDHMGYRRSVRFSAAMRRAADEYLEKRCGSTSTRKTTIFGYSLGGGGALALAMYYQEYPESGIKLADVYCGGGIYDPGVAMRKMIERKEMDYMIAPQILLSCNWYNKLDVDFCNVFLSPLLEDYPKDCDGVLHPYELTAKYGSDLTVYMHPDVFTEGMNEDIVKLYDTLRAESLCQEWSPHFKLHLFHSAADSIAPVECCDDLYKSVGKSSRHFVKYHRTRTGTHYDTAMASYVALMKHLIF